MSATAAGSLEYKNEFFAISLRESRDRPGSWVFSSGISLPRFNPIIWGRTGICSNAAFKGLQQLRADVAFYALERGVVTKNAERAGRQPRHGHGWYQEDPLLLENASPGIAREILEFGARNLAQTILTASHPGVQVPAGLAPAAMQGFLESLGVPNYREAAPPPIAKPQAA